MYFSSRNLSVSAAGLALVLAALLPLLAFAAADCGFHADCRPGETYRVPIPCEGKCSSYVQCTNGAAAEKKCGKYFFTTKSFDPVSLECVRDTVDCDWWKKVVTTTTGAPPTTTPAASTSTPAPETTPSTSTTETAPSTSTEASTTTTVSTSRVLNLFKIYIDFTESLRSLSTSGGAWMRLLLVNPHY